MCGVKKNKSAFGGKKYCFECTDAYEKEICSVCTEEKKRNAFSTGQLHHEKDTKRNKYLRCNACLECISCGETPGAQHFLGTSKQCKRCEALKKEWECDVCHLHREAKYFEEKNLDNHKQRKDHLICEACREDGFDGEDWFGDIVRHYQCTVCTGLLGHNRFDEESKRKWRKQEGKNVDIACLKCRTTHVPSNHGSLSVRTPEKL
jgi:hypothetical protein